MPVAKSFQSMTFISEPYTANGHIYIQIKMKKQEKI